VRAQECVQCDRAPSQRSVVVVVVVVALFLVVVALLVVLDEVAKVISVSAGRRAW
jgi:hypothetical protein